MVAAQTRRPIWSCECELLAFTFIGDSAMQKGGTNGLVSDLRVTQALGGESHLKSCLPRPPWQTEEDHLQIAVAALPLEC